MKAKLNVEEEVDGAERKKMGKIEMKKNERKKERKLNKRKIERQSEDNNNTKLWRKVSNRATIDGITLTSTHTYAE